MLLSILTKEEFNYIKNKIKNQINAPTIDDIKKINLTKAAFYYVMRHFLKSMRNFHDKSDNIAMTPPRNTEVMSSVWENYVSGADTPGVTDGNAGNPNTVFNKLMYNNPESVNEGNPAFSTGGGLTPIGWAAVALWPFVLVTSFHHRCLRKATSAGSK